MTKKIFKNIFLVSLLTLILGTSVIMGVLYNHYERSIMTELKKEAEYVSRGVMLSDETYLESLNSDSRITWIDSDGTVLYDTQADVKTMENHADREEFIQAENTGVGQSIRTSNTLSEKTLYYAVRLNNDSVIRVSTTQYTVWSLLTGMIQAICILFLIVAVLSGLLASKLAKRIVKPVNEIDLEKPDLEGDYDELAPLLGKINRQNTMISLQMKELERKQAEFRAITENMEEGFLVVNEKTEILSYNSAALKLLGSQMTESSQSVFSLNRTESFRNAVEAALKGKNDIEVLQREGRFYQILANPVLDDNTVAGAIIILIDITEEEEREKLRREFTSNVSHELKTPLTSIYGMSDLLMNGLVKQEDVTEFGKNIHTESGRLIALVNDILRISQLDEGVGLGEKEEIDLYELSRNVMERLETVATKSHVSMELMGEHVKIVGYFGILTEVVYNICDNAIKYNNEGGSVSIAVKDAGKKYTLSVKDTGMGIPEADKERIFERFYRVDKSHSKQIGGTGLGLAIVKHGAACNGAGVKVESVLGKGTTFTLEFEK